MYGLRKDIIYQVKFSMRMNGNDRYIREMSDVRYQVTTLPKNIFIYVFERFTSHNYLK